MAFGLLLVVFGIAFLWRGVGPLATLPHGTYSHRMGVVRTVVGACMLFVGLNFTVTVRFRVPRTAERPPGEPLYVLVGLTTLSGVTLLTFGGLCLRRTPWVNPECAEVDAAVLIFVGTGTLVFSVLPLAYMWTQRKHPGAMRYPTFLPGAFVFFIPGIVAFSVGLACVGDALLLVHDCPAPSASRWIHGSGKWSPAVKLIVFGSLFLFTGTVLCLREGGGGFSTARTPVARHFYSPPPARKRRPKPLAGLVSRGPE